MKNIYYLLFIVIIIFVLFNINTIERFDDTNEDYLSNISLEDFNQTFSTNIKELPYLTALIGFDANSDKQIYIHCNKPYRYLTCTIKYWIEHIHFKLNRKKYYFVLNCSDGFLHDDITDYKTFISSNTNNPIPYMFAFCRRWNDKKTLLLPDPYFACDKWQNKNFYEIDNTTVSWINKKNECIWRGNIKNGLPLNFFNSDNKHNLNQRQYFVKLYNENYFKNVDYKDEFSSISDQIRYKYILDIDGWASTWDATVWKLYSGCVLLKVETTWHQWYYPHLIAWVHFVPVKNDFSDLNEIIDWCMNNEILCLKIIENAKKFVKTYFDFDFVNNTVIEKMNNYLILTNQMYNA